MIRYRQCKSGDMWTWRPTSDEFIAKLRWQIKNHSPVHSWSQVRWIDRQDDIVHLMLFFVWLPFAQSSIDRPDWTHSVPPRPLASTGERLCPFRHHGLSVPWRYSWLGILEGVEVSIRSDWQKMDRLLHEPITRILLYENIWRNTLTRFNIIQ